MRAFVRGMNRADWKRQFVKGTYDRSPETLRRVADYCLQDCRTEIGVGDAVGPLSAYERRVWELDQRINQRGLRIDFEYVHAALAAVREASIPLAKEFAELTGGLAPTQGAKLLAWCNSNGLAIDSLAKEKLAALGITGVDDDDSEDDAEAYVPGSQEIPSGVRRALEIRAVLGSASIKKLDRMLVCACGDGRVRYTQQYHGAGTGRTAGKLIQPTNFPRSKIEGGHDPDALVAAIMLARDDPRTAVEYISMLYGDPIAAVASGLRHAIIADEGCEFVTGDFAGIEMRIVLALAGQHDKVALIAAGGSPYLDFGELMFGHPIDKHNLAEYIPAKSGVLGCGFQCGDEKFDTQFLAGKDRPLAKRIVDTYRKVWAPEVPKLWAGLEQAALTAVQNQSQEEAYGVVYKYVAGWLGCHLPDGQIMWYRNPRTAMRPMPWDPTDIRPGWSYQAMKMGQWKTIDAYGGLLCENVVQKLARGMLVEACYRIEAENLPLVLTVYDECMSEVPAARADYKAYEQIMAEPSAYARAIKVPIAVEGWQGRRYRK